MVRKALRLAEEDPFELFQVPTPFITADEHLQAEGFANMGVTTDIATSHWCILG